MFIFIIPLLLNFIAPVFQWKLSDRRLNDQTKWPLSIIFLISFLLAAGLAILAFIISVNSVPAEIKCAIGCTIFIMIGIVNVCFVVPLIGFTSLSEYYKNHKQKVQPNQN